MGSRYAVIPSAMYINNGER